MWPSASRARRFPSRRSRASSPFACARANPPDVAQLGGNDTFLIAATGKLEPRGAYVDDTLEKRARARFVAAARDVHVFERETGRTLR
jgi:hypothetical protein